MAIVSRAGAGYCMGDPRQEGDLAEMIWRVPEMISCLSDFSEPAESDVILPGMPAAVGPLRRGDVPEAAIGRLGALDVRGV